MKAFVIKNKEGKYLAVSSSDYEHYWTTIDFAHYFRFLNGTHNAKQEAEEFRDSKYPNCEVVPVTIAEGDLEHKLEIREEALKLACIKLLKNEFRTNIDVIKSLESDFIEQAKENIK